MTAIQDIPLKTISGEDSSLQAYCGKVLLVVNVASKCGLTKQVIARYAPSLAPDHPTIASAIESALGNNDLTERI